MQLVEQLEKTPNPDAQAVVAPRIVTLSLRTAPLGRICATPRKKGKLLDVEGDVESQPFAVGPTEVAALFNGRIVVAIVGRQLEHRLIPRVRGCAVASVS